MINRMILFKIRVSDRLLIYIEISTNYSVRSLAMVLNILVNLSGVIVPCWAAGIELTELVELFLLTNVIWLLSWELSEEWEVLWILRFRIGVLSAPTGISRLLWLPADGRSPSAEKLLLDANISMRSFLKLSIRFLVESLVSCASICELLSVFVVSIW